MTRASVTKGEETRQRILDVAQAAIVEKGFTGTSIDELISECGLSKGGFFYHFRDKNDLARSLLQRYIEEDERVFDEVFARAASLVDDPLQKFLLGLRFLADVMGDMPNGHPGCLVAISCYQERIFDQELKNLNAQAVLQWRQRFRKSLQEIALRYQPREPVELDELADMVSTVLEGGIVMSKALRDPASLRRQILTFRLLVQALFVPAPESESREALSFGARN
ncbi:MAG: TetR/AcrR family transcriptional regulator [Salinarimonas sp.]